jgi:hypothetical protein
VYASLQATLAVLDDITACIQMLAARPTGLDEFVNYMVGSHVLCHTVCMHTMQAGSDHV